MLRLIFKKESGINIRNKRAGLLRRDFSRNKYLYLMLVPLVLYYVIFCYIPMYGIVISFQNYMPGKGFFHSDWVGLQNFTDFFSSYYFWRLIRNTFLLNVYCLIFTFPAPIIMALLLNELRDQMFKRAIQTISYLPYFISTVVICGIVLDFLSNSGPINALVKNLGGQSITFLLDPKWFRSIYVVSDIWQGLGWNSIIFLAALSGINVELYDSARIDGAGRWKQAWHITLPSITYIILILLILRMGSLMSVGFEKIILLYNPSLYETADVISTFVYRKGLLDMSYSYSTAVGFFNSVVNFVLLVAANSLSKKVTEESLW